jgi:hypothetical protein
MAFSTNTHLIERLCEVLCEYVRIFPFKVSLGWFLYSIGKAGLVKKI